jgi:hypothetical protein
VAAGATAQSYNRVVNGAMQHSQETGNIASATAASGTYYAADQWFGSWGVGVGTLNVVRWGGSNSPNGSANYLTFTCQTAVTSLAAANYVYFGQPIEGARLADLGWGAAGAKPVVLRFWASMPAGTYSVALINGASNRSYVAQFTSTGLGWVQYSFVIPGDTTGTWAKDNTVGLYLLITIATGSTNVGVTGWQAGNKIAAPGQLTSLAASSTYSIADVGLYADPNNTGLPPPWAAPDFVSELAACKRYWQLIQQDQVGYASAAAAYFGSTYSFPSTMRVNPTIAALSAGTLTNIASSGADSQTAIGCRQYMQATATGTFAVAGRTYAVSARM